MLAGNSRSKNEIRGLSDLTQNLVNRLTGGVSLHLKAFGVRVLENVAIAMHCNLRPLDASSVLIRFNYDAHAQFKFSQIRRRLIAFLLLIRYVTL